MLTYGKRWSTRVLTLYGKIGLWIQCKFPWNGPYQLFAPLFEKRHISHSITQKYIKLELSTLKKSLSQNLFSTFSYIYIYIYIYIHIHILLYIGRVTWWPNNDTVDQMQIGRHSHVEERKWMPISGTDAFRDVAKLIHIHHMHLDVGCLYGGKRPYGRLCFVQLLGTPMTTPKLGAD